MDSFQQLIFIQILLVTSYFYGAEVLEGVKVINNAKNYLFSTNQFEL